MEEYLTQTKPRCLKLSSNDSRIKEAFEVHGGVGKGVNLKKLVSIPKSRRRAKYQLIIHTSIPHVIIASQNSLQTLIKSHNIPLKQTSMDEALLLPARMSLWEHFFFSRCMPPLPHLLNGDNNTIRQWFRSLVISKSTHF